ncbi:MAG TPA: preprotein translocase subunit SecE [Candidatus Lustribacter sp.]|nr:preprotein translocase subunit SecE [Candidatus Lustribacter sp.]
MAETSAATRDSGRVSRKRGQSGNPVSRFLRSMSLFVSQIIDELRKVVRPTRSELVNYTTVVILFVLVIMAIVAGLDLLFQKLVLLAFAKN